MIAFEVTVNGKRVCTAGLDRLGVISTTLTYVQRKDKAELDFNVGGLLSHQKEGDEYVTWIKETLKPGDSITIQIVEAAESNEPKERRREAPKTEAQRERAYRERLKREYGFRDARRPRSPGSRRK